jgi:hypothetical protein
MLTPDHAQKAGHDQSAGLIDLTGMTLEELGNIDDSVVAGAIRLLVARRHGGADYMESFNDYNSAP